METKLSSTNLNEHGLIVESVANLTNTNIQLPYLQYIPNSPNKNIIGEGLVFGHGLGVKDPSKTYYGNDHWGAMISEVGLNLNIPTLLYTARGHGDSHGWEETALSNPKQFQWENLADDMKDISIYVGYSNRIIASGYSMGSATSLFTAIKYPDFVKAVIMVKPPSSWIGREIQRNTLLTNATKLKNSEINTGNIYHSVLFGTAYSDLPSIDTDLNLYTSINCRVLILGTEDDISHPIEVAIKLNELLKYSELHIAATIEIANEIWPSIITKFINSLYE